MSDSPTSATGEACRVAAGASGAQADVGLVADHIEHVAKVAGHDHVGIGGDLDGIGFDEAPAGMNSVSGYPLLFAELIRRGWSDADLAKLAGGNVLRVMRQAEAVAASMKDEPPAMDDARSPSNRSVK